MMNGIDNDTAVACLRLIDKHTPANVRPYTGTARVNLGALRAAGFEIGRRQSEQRAKWQRPTRRRSVVARGLLAARAYLAQKSATPLSQAHFAKLYNVSQVCVSQNVRHIRLGRARAVNAAQPKAEGRASANYGVGTTLAREFLSQPRAQGELSKFAREKGIAITSLWSAVQRVRESKGVAA